MGMRRGRGRGSEGRGRAGVLEFLMTEREGI